MRFIVTDKDVITNEYNERLGCTSFTTWKYDGDQIIGKKQLVYLIQRQAEQNIKEKYLMAEVERLLSEVVLVDIKDKKALEKIFTNTKFVD